MAPGKHIGSHPRHDAGPSAAATDAPRAGKAGRAPLWLSGGALTGDTGRLSGGALTGDTGRLSGGALVRGLGALLGAGGLLLAASGCAVKRGEDANLITGKQQFVAKCGACHTLARASTRGTVGPNLDEAFRASLAEGLERSSIETVVKGQVENPNRFGVMPAKLAAGATLNDIAAYIAHAASRPGKDSGLLATAVQAPGAGKPAVERAGKLEIPADPSGQLSYVTNKASATAGSVTISMPNTSGVSHNIAIEAGSHGASGSGPVLGASSFVTKGSTSISVKLKPGTYTFFCQAPGHRAAGMYGTLTVK